MITVNASARPSKVHGIGLFANERIPKGTVVWKFDPRFNLVFDPKEVEAMPPAQQQMIKTYAYLSKTSGKYIFPADDGRFLNHSSLNCNIGDIQDYQGNDEETPTIALRDIEKDEELLIDYRTYDANDATSKEEYLNS